MDTITTIQSLLTCNGSARPATVALTPSETSLIAAAPTMLDVLRKAEDELRRCGLDCVDSDERTDTLLTEIRAAIQRAEA